MGNPRRDLWASIGRIFLVAVWIGLLFLIATNIQAGWLYVIIAFFSMLLLVSVIYPFVSLRGLRVEMHAPELVERGRGASFRLTVVNKSRWSRFLVRVSVSGEDFETVPGAFLAVHIPGRGRVSFGGELIARRRGRLHIHHVRLATGAPVGLFVAGRRAPCGVECLVHPFIPEGRDRSIVEGEIAEAMRRFDRRAYSEDPYHYHLREYTPGDSLRLMHWKQTARRDEPVVRVAERHPQAEQTLLVDDVAGHYGAGGAGAFESVLERTAAVAKHLVLGELCRVTLIGLMTPPVLVESMTDWTDALRWLALIELREATGRTHAVRGAHILFSIREKKGNGEDG